nr:SRPBCC family protein [Luteipulveratus mongoliensis]
MSDPVQMAHLGEEIHEVRLLGGAQDAAVGVRFEGINRLGRRRWNTICTITDRDETRFGYDVRAPKPLDLSISRWQYDIRPLGTDRCQVTETNWIKAPVWFIPLAVTITGTLDRPHANLRHIDSTLQRLKTFVEKLEPSSSGD